MSYKIPQPGEPKDYGVAKVKYAVSRKRYEGSEEVKMSNVKMLKLSKEEYIAGYKKAYTGDSPDEAAEVAWEMHNTLADLEELKKEWDQLPDEIKEKSPHLQEFFSE